MADGPGAGLRLLDVSELAERLGEYHLYHAARADLLRRLGRSVEAAACYRQALELTTNAPERTFLEGRLREMDSLITTEDAANSPP